MMSMKRPLLAIAILFPLSLLWNAFVHLVVLADLNASVQSLRRADMGDKLWLSLLLTLGVVSLFVWGFTRFVRTPSTRDALLYGLFFALVAGLLVDLDQYVIYPIPGHVAAAWFLAGLLEFVGYSLLLSGLLRDRGSRGAA